MVIQGTKEPYGVNGHRQFERVLVPSLKELKANPDGRATEPNTKDLKGAVLSVNKMVLDPLHVNGDSMEVIEGHRRLFVAVALGIPHVWAWVYYKCSKAEMHTLYAMLNLNKKAHTGAQKVEAELKGVVGATRNGIVTQLFGSTSKATTTFQRIFDEPELTEKLKAGQLSPSNLSRARSALKFCKREQTDEALLMVLRWMMDLKQSLALYSAMTHARKVFKINGSYNKAYSPTALLGFIERGVPIGAVQRSREAYDKAMEKQAKDQTEETQLALSLKQARI